MILLRPTGGNRWAIVVTVFEGQPMSCDHLSDRSGCEGSGSGPEG